MFTSIPLLKLWLPILTGVTGFALTLTYDLLQVVRVYRGRTAVAVGAAILVSAATLGLFFIKPLPSSAWWIICCGLGVIFISAYMFLYSTVLEIPHANIGKGDESVLIETGSYRITRHPGFLWYSILVVSVILMYREEEVAAAALSLLAMELIVVTVEDRFMFPKIIPGYTGYRKRVPMLFPIRLRKRESE